MDAVAQIQMNGLIVEHREAHLSFVAYNFYSVFLGTLMSHEAPAATPVKSTLKFKYGIDRVFHIIESSTIRAIAVSTGDNAEEVLEQVYLVWSKVIEITATGDVRLKTPRQFRATAIVKVAGRTCKAELHGKHLSYDAVVDDALHTTEIREIAAIVSHKARHARLLADAVYTDTVLVAGRKGLLDINRFAGTHGHDGIRGMSHWWCGNINGIDIRIIDKCLGIGIPMRNVVVNSIGTCFQFVAAHHGHHS